MNHHFLLESYSSCIQLSFASFSTVNARLLLLSLGGLSLACGSIMAQTERSGRRGGGGPRPMELGETPADLGSSGIVWYPILKDGIAEAKRTNKPIMFMAVASQCGGISGVF